MGPQRDIPGVSIEDVVKSDGSQLQVGLKEKSNATGAEVSLNVLNPCPRLGALIIIVLHCLQVPFLRSRPVAVESVNAL